MRLAALTLSLPLLVLATSCSRQTPAASTAVAALASPAAAPASPAAVVAYLAALTAVEQARAPVSLEALFDQAEAAQAALMEVTGEQAVLERYSDTEFAALQAQVRGLKLHRELDIYAQPEPAFFLALAKAHGLPADIAFFEQYAATWGPDLVPVYLKLRPQPSPCVRFGEGLIGALYAGWQQYAAAHAGHYAARVVQNLADLEEAVALGTCACAGLETVRSEQAEFLKRFPDTPKTAEIKARREQLVTDPDVLPVNCR